MAIYSYDRYTSTGQASFAITFDYLSSEHIKIYLDGVLQSTGYSIDTGTNQVTFTSAPGSGTVVLVQRVTPKTKADYQAQIADFANGSVLTESDLDNAVLGLLYITQEAEDSGATNALSKDLADNTWDAEDTRIKDVGTPTAALDAVTKQYVDGLSLYNDAISVPQKWSFSGDTVETDFTLSSPDPASTDVDMYVVDIDGVVQKPTTDFTISATTLTFGSAPASGTNNITVRNFGVARDILAQPIQPDSTSTVGVTVKGLASQTANLQNWTDSADAVKASVDKDGNLSTTGTLGVTGATTLSDTLGVTGATTLSDTLGVTGATTLSGGVSGDMNILTGALQYAGVDAMSIRQIVQHDGATPTGFTEGGYSISSVDVPEFMDIEISITPKKTGSNILLLAGARTECYSVDVGTAIAYLLLYQNHTVSTLGATMDGTQLRYGSNGFANMSTQDRIYQHTCLQHIATSGTAGVAMKFGLALQNAVTGTYSTIRYSPNVGHLYAIEIG